MRLIASAVVALLVTLLLFYAMQSMIATQGSAVEKPLVTAGLRLLAVDQLPSASDVRPGKRPLPHPPSMTVASPPAPVMTFEPANKPALSPPAAVTPELPAVQPGGEPYLGAYRKPSQDQAPSVPAKAVTQQRLTDPPPQAPQPREQSVPPRAALNSASTTHSAITSTAGAPAVDSGSLSVPDGHAGTLDGSTNSGDGMLEDEVVALYKTTPQYPRKAARSGKEGWVKIEFTITPQGKVADPKVIASKPRRIFDRAALRAIKQWRFKPKTVDGKAVSRRAVQVIEFRLATG
jgi:protein TonB